VRILSPSENKRFNEMVGFVGLSLAVLIAQDLAVVQSLVREHFTGAGG